jgi:drug/metabolite transporter (DMT)-like permease
MFLCTLAGAAAQILFKLGARAIDQPIWKALLTPELFLGYALYGGSTAMFVLALRRGQLSVLYPIISLTYVWVAVLSVLIFREDLAPLRVAGLATVVTGVAVLGKENRV